MFKRFLIATVISVFCCFGVIAQQESSDEAFKSSPKSKYETFLAQPDKIFLTRVYDITAPNSRFRVKVSVAWALSEKEHVYAANIGGQNIDFEKLESLQNKLDELLQTIRTFDQLNISSVGYSSKNLSASYYSFKDNIGKEIRNLYIVAGSDIEQSATSLEPLEKLRDYVAQSRAKILSLQTK